MEELLNAIECVVNEYDYHIAKEPIGLSCWHYICKECIPKNGVKIVCSNCRITNTIDLNISQVSFEAQYSINENIQKLIEHAKTRFDTLLIQVAGKTLFDLIFKMFAISFS